MSLKRTWKGRVKAVVFEPLALIARLAALVPTPYMHLRRFYGIFAPNHGLRAHIVPTPPDPASASAPVAPKRPKSMPWDLLMRVWRIDALRCPYCGGRMRVVCAIGDPDPITADTECRPQSTRKRGPTAPAIHRPERRSDTPTLSERPVILRQRSDRQPAARSGAPSARPTSRSKATDTATTPRLLRPDPRKVVRRRESSQPSVCDCVPFVPGSGALFFLYSPELECEYSFVPGCRACSFLGLCRALAPAGVRRERLGAWQVSCAW